MTEIYRLRGHGSQVTCLAIAATGVEGGDQVDEDEEAMALGGAELVSVSTDGSVRLWAESDEILSPEVEAEERADEEHEREEMVREEVAVVGAPRASEANVLTKKTIATERCADELADALQAVSRQREDTAAPADPKMAARGFQDAALFLQDTLQRVKSGDLEFALAQLPLTLVALLLEELAMMLRRNRETLLVCRCLLFLAKMHFQFVSTSEAMAAVVDSVAQHGSLAIKNYEVCPAMSLPSHLSIIQDLVGFNTEALLYFQNELGPQLQKFTEQRRIAKSRNKKKK